MRAGYDRMATESSIQSPDVKPLYVVVDEVGEISEETWEYLKKRVDTSRRRLILSPANYIADNPQQPYL